MNRNSIEKRIHSLFLLLFGVIFSFLFVLTSIYLNMIKGSSNEKINLIVQFSKSYIENQKKEIIENILEKDYSKVGKKFEYLLDSLKVNQGKLSIVDDGKCSLGDMDGCLNLIAIFKKFKQDEAFSFESLGNIYLFFPYGDKQEIKSFFALTLPVREISSEKGFLDQLCYYVIPFLILVLLTFIIYNYTEKNLIRPTINKILDNERLELQKKIFRQFAHDIQSPIVALDAVLDSADQFPDDSKELIVHALNRITEISNDLLKNKSDIEKSSCLTEVLEVVMEEKYLQYSEKKFDIKIESVESIQGIKVKGWDLYRVLSNLLNNSIEAFVKENSGIIKLKFRVKDNTLKIIIIDNGCGIEDRLIEKILDGGYTSKPSGNGIGLSSAKTWVESYDGKFEIQSEINQGTSISFTLPFGEIISS